MFRSQNRVWDWVCDANILHVGPSFTILNVVFILFSAILWILKNQAQSSFLFKVLLDAQCSLNTHIDTHTPTHMRESQMLVQHKSNTTTHSLSVAGMTIGVFVNVCQGGKFR